MPGLLQRDPQPGAMAPGDPAAGMAPPQGGMPPPGEAPMGAPPAPAGEPQAAPPGQEGGDPQQMVAVLLDGMLNSLYEPQVTQGVEEMLQQWDNPVEAMARAIHDVMMITIGLLEREGRMVPPEVMLEAGVELARAVGEMAIEMGEVDEEDELAIEMGLFIALAMVGDDMQDETGQQYRAMGQQLAEQRMGAVNPDELDEETLAMLQEAPEQQPQQQPQQAPPQPGTPMPGGY